MGAGAVAAFLWSIPIAAAGGLIGLGGAEFRLPVLVSVLHHTARQAVPLNLAVSLATISFSLIGRAGTLPSVMPLSSDLVPLALGSGGAAFFGADRARNLSEVQLRRVIFILLVAIGSALVIEAFVPIAGSGFLPHDPVMRAFAGFLFGMGIGLVSSLLGVAGGEVIIPTLVFAFGVDIKIAGTASLLVSLPTVVIGIARYARLRAYDDRATLRSTVAPMSLGSAVGALAGGLALGLVSPTLLKAGLGTILIWSAWRTFRHGQ